MIIKYTTTKILNYDMFKFTKYVNSYMTKTSNKLKSSQKNKNNKTIPKNLEKKQYLESLSELKQSIKDNP